MVSGEDFPNNANPLICDLCWANEITTSLFFLTVMMGIG